MPPPPAWLSRPPPSRCPLALSPARQPCPVGRSRALGGKGCGQGSRSCKATVSRTILFCHCNWQRAGFPGRRHPRSGRPVHHPPAGAPCQGDFTLWPRVPAIGVGPPGCGGGPRMRTARWPAAKPKPAPWEEGTEGRAQWWTDTRTQEPLPSRSLTSCGPPSTAPLAYLTGPLGFVSGSVPPLLPRAVLQGPGRCGRHVPAGGAPQWTCARGHCLPGDWRAALTPPGMCAQHPGRYPGPCRASGSVRRAAATMRVTEPSFRPLGYKGRSQHHPMAGGCPVSDRNTAVTPAAPRRALVTDNHEAAGSGLTPPCSVPASSSELVVPHPRAAAELVTTQPRLVLRPPT